MDDFAKRYRDRIGFQRDEIERAKAGQLPDYLSPIEISSLCAADGTPEWPMAQGIMDASERGVLRMHRHINSQNDKIFVHRDEMRRYFQSLDLMPKEGTPLWCWLRGKTASAAGRLRSDQQDKADFQQTCKEYRDVSPTTRITGPEGVVAAKGGSYAKLYKQKTLESWAREVAPEGVKGNRGRPAKKYPRILEIDFPALTEVF